MTKGGNAANYIFWLRRLNPAVGEEPSKPPYDDDGDEKDPAHMKVQDVAFAYETRPNTKVLADIDVDVSAHTPSESEPCADFSRFAQASS